MARFNSFENIWFEHQKKMLLSNFIFFLKKYNIVPHPFIQIIGKLLSKANNIIDTKTQVEVWKGGNKLLFL